MNRFIAIALAFALSTTAAADPVSIKVESGTLLDKDGSIVEVDKGLYLNDEAAQQVFDTLVALDKNRTELTSAIKECNKRLTESSAYVPGLPTWATVVISAALSALTIVAGAFVAREATRGN